MKNILGVAGALLILGTLFGGNLSYITNWSTAELVGYNVWSIISIVGGGYLCRWRIPCLPWFSRRKKERLRKVIHPLPILSISSDWYNWYNKIDEMTFIC